MCGLIGFATGDREMREQDRRRFITEGLIASSLRGVDSTGLALIYHEPAQEGKPEVYKRAVNAYDFVQLRKYSDLVNHLAKYSMALGHTRAATTGAVKDDNAHPFQHKHITLVHNGVITNYRALGVECAVPVDSAHVTVAMADHGELETLKKLKGGYVFIWHNANDDTLNIARNHARPIYWCLGKGHNTMYWGSELEMVYAIMKRHDIEVDGKFQFPSTHTWYKFNKTDLRKWVRVPFVPTVETPKLLEKSENTSVPKWRAHQQRMPNGYPSTNSTLPTGMIDSSLEGDSELDEIREQAKDIPFELHGRPKGHKGEARAATRLGKIGFRFEQPALFRPASYSPYKNQHGRRLGSVSGVVERIIPGKTGEKKKCLIYPASIDNVKLDDYLFMAAIEKAYVRVVNVRRSKASNGSYTVVASPMWATMTEMRADWERLRELRRPTNGGDIHTNDPTDGERAGGDNDNTASPTETPTPEPISLRGPGGRYVSRETFLELTRFGCGVCSGLISDLDAESVQWYGEPPAPICPECVDKPAKPAVMPSVARIH